MRITLKKQTVKDLLAHASRDPVKKVLNSIYFSKSGEAQTTDGHSALVVKTKTELTEGFIVDYGCINSAIRAVGKFTQNELGKLVMLDDVVFDFETKSIIVYSGVGQTVSAHMKIISGNYPDINSYIPTGKPKPITQICFNKGILAKVPLDAYGPAGCITFNFYGENLPGVFRGKTPDHFNFICVVMPVKLCEPGTTNLETESKSETVEATPAETPATEPEVVPASGEDSEFKKSEASTGEPVPETIEARVLAAVNLGIPYREICAMKKQYYKKFVLFSILIETERQDVANFFNSKHLATLLDVLNSKIIKFIGGIK